MSLDLGWVQVCKLNYTFPITEPMLTTHMYGVHRTGFGDTCAPEGGSVHFMGKVKSKPRFLQVKFAKAPHKWYKIRVVKMAVGVGGT